MIAKVGSSTRIKATLDYLENDHDRVAWKEAHNLASTDREFVLNEMQKIAECSSTQKPIYHYSISWDPEDNPTKDEMIQAARKTLSDLGMEEHHALFVAHNDHAYKHIHVLANRVHPVEGTAWDRWMDYGKLETSLRGLERDHQWREVPGHHHQLVGQEKPKYGQTFNRLEAEQIKRGEKPFFLIVRETAGPDFEKASSWEDLHQKLAEKGLTILRGSRGTGGRVTDGHEVANLSKVHRNYSMGNLEKRFGNFKSLDQIFKSKNLTKEQIAFNRFERAYRLNLPKANQLKKNLANTMNALNSVRKVNNTLKSFISASTPSNPAFVVISKIGRSIINNLKQNELERSKSIER